MSQIAKLASAVSDLQRSSGAERFNNRVAPLDAIAEFMRPLLSDLSFLPPDQRSPGPVERRKVHLFTDASRLFTILATIWAPGQRTAIHDHEYWDVSGIVTGMLMETHFEPDPAASGRVRPARSVFHHPTQISFVAPDRPNIHALANPTNDVTISLNIHGTSETTFERNVIKQFDLGVGLRPFSLAL